MLCLGYQLLEQRAADTQGLTTKPLVARYVADKLPEGHSGWESIQSLNDSIKDSLASKRRGMTLRHFEPGKDRRWCGGAVSRRWNTSSHVAVPCSALEETTGNHLRSGCFSP